jgi:threonine/homoserine/homoserine lactone efflux protein
LSVLFTFFWVSLLATLVPGPDTAVVLKNAVAGGRRNTVVTAAGCSTGQHFWGAVSVAGLAGILARSVAAFSTVK